MKKIIFICLRYLDDDEKSVTIGGIQTYVTNLINISKNIGLECIVVQPSSHSFRVVHDGVSVLGIVTSEKKGFKRFKYDLFSAAQNVYSQGDILLFATERLSVKTGIQETIAIQHGISWDITKRGNRNLFQRLLFLSKRTIRTLSLLQDSLNVHKLVCVDYNYINWLRTQVDHVELNYITIPNFSFIPNVKFEKAENGIIKIIFARRLQEYRGTRLFASAIGRILDEFDNVEVTVAGNGPDEAFLKGVLNDNRVKFITYSSDDAIRIHSDKHIAIVPSIGSEGTSLSLIESMSCCCAPIATDVGGMTNIIIDGFNGLLIKPSEDDLYDAIKYLLTHKKELDRIAANAYTTCENAFSYKRWESQWTKLLKEIGNIE